MSGGRPARLFHYAWPNPRPSHAIQSVRLEATAAAAPFLVALSADSDSSSEHR